MSQPRLLGGHVRTMGMEAGGRGKGRTQKELSSGQPGTGWTRWAGRSGPETAELPSDLVELTVLFRPHISEGHSWQTKWKTGCKAVFLCRGSEEVRMLQVSVQAHGMVGRDRVWSWCVNVGIWGSFYFPFLRT